LESVIPPPQAADESAPPFGPDDEPFEPPSDELVLAGDSLPPDPLDADFDSLGFDSADFELEDPSEPESPDFFGELE
jgi:hypothetical protein